jgi:prephenate dehydrogenase
LLAQPTYNTIAVVGVGLIGGSIGRAVLERGIAQRVIGVGRREESLRRAEELGLITEGTTNLAAGTAPAELVVVCTPVKMIAGQVREALRQMAPGSLITDAGSTKAELVDQIESAHGALEGAAGPMFVGSHPLAGSHESGPEAASGELFVDRCVVVTPTSKTDVQAVDRIQAFWEALGAYVRRLTPEQHDAVLAATSHLPHLVASALAAITPAEWLDFTGSGWRDTTRIAAGNVELWMQIVAANRSSVVSALDKMAETIDSMRTAVAQRDDTALQQLLDRGKNIRDSVAN